MQHRIKKIHFKGGQDATQMKLRHMVKHFFMSGSLKTTTERAKVLKGVVDMLCGKLVKDTNANRTVVLRATGSDSLTRTLFSVVTPQIEGKTSGFVTIVKNGPDRRDAAESSTVRFAHGITLTSKVEEPPVEKNTDAKETKSKPKKKAVVKTEEDTV